MVALQYLEGFWPSLNLICDSPARNPTHLLRCNNKQKTVLSACEHFILVFVLFFVSRQTWKHISLSCTCLELNTLFAFFTSILQRVKCSTFCSWTFLVGFFFFSPYFSGSAEAKWEEASLIFFFLSTSSSENMALLKGAGMSFVFFFSYVLEQSCQNNLRRRRVEQQEENTCKDFVLFVVVEFTLEKTMYIYVHMQFGVFFVVVFFLLRPVQVCSLLRLLLAML